MFVLLRRLMEPAMPGPLLCVCIIGASYHHFTDGPFFQNSIVYIDDDGRCHPYSGNSAWLFLGT